MKKCVLGIDIGGTRIRLGFLTEDGELVGCSSAFVNNNGAFIEDVFRTIEEKTKHLEGYELTAISVGVPSTVSQDKKTVISTPNIKALNDIRLQELMEELFHLPVFVDRDVNNILLTDIQKYDLDISRTIIAVYIGTGIGNAVVVNGKQLSGKNGCACELGHIPLVSNGRRCVCGNTGCAETVASGAYLKELADEYYGGDIVNIFDHQDDERIQSFIENLSLVISTEVNIFDPDYLIIGGGVPAMKNFPKDRLVDRIRSHMRKPLVNGETEIMFSEDGEYSGVRGSALSAFAKLS